MGVSSALDTQQQSALTAVQGLKEHGSMACKYAAATVMNPRVSFAYQGRLE